MKKAPLKLMIADDHDITLYGLADYVKTLENIELIGAYNSGMTLLMELDNKPADVVMCDLDMPKVDGFQILREVKKTYPDTKVLICTMHINSWTLKKLHNQQADGIISKSNVMKDMRLALQAIQRGRAFFSSDVEKVLQVKSNATSDFQKVPLTQREKDVLKLIMEEYSSQQIAAKLELSINTVETHRKNLFLKFDVNNVVGLVKKAMQKGMD